MTPKLPPKPTHETAGSSEDLDLLHRPARFQHAQANAFFQCGKIWRSPDEACGVGILRIHDKPAFRKIDAGCAYSISLGTNEKHPDGSHFIWNRS